MAEGNPTLLGRTDQWAVDRVYSTLDAVDALLGWLDVPYTIIGGTLLGALRHGGLIPWDDDGDVAIPEDSNFTRSAATRWLEQRGFGLGSGTRVTYRAYPLDGKLVRRGDDYFSPFVDIFPLRERRISHKIAYADAGARDRWPNEYFFEREFGSFGRRKFGPLNLSSVPDDVARDYLDRCYGMKWSTEAHLSWDHLRNIDRRDQVVTLTSFGCSLPAGTGWRRIARPGEP
jgi:lipopolysaccharide cholinephosphotransferase